MHDAQNTTLENFSEKAEKEAREAAILAKEIEAINDCRFAKAVWTSAGAGILINDAVINVSAPYGADGYWAKILVKALRSGVRSHGISSEEDK